MHAVMQCFNSVLAYFAAGVSYVHKMFVKLKSKKFDLGKFLKLVGSEDKSFE